MSAFRRPAAQSTVEFALVIPLFLLLLLAFIDFGRLLFTYASVANGSRELARSMTITSNPASSAIAAFNNLTIIGGSVSPATVVALAPAAGAGSGSISCTGASSPLCTIKVTSTTTSTILTSQAGASGSATFTAPSTYQFNPTSTGDFVMMTWLAPDQLALMQGYIQLCQLPLTAACTFPTFPFPTLPPTTRASFTDGFLQADVGYTFQFNPLFQNRLGGVLDVSFMRPTSLVTSSVRTYGE